MTVTHETLNAWADDGLGPVALTIKQRLVPVEGDTAVVFPPTYAKNDNRSPYDIDTLADGTKVCTLDSVGSQANRMEPQFKRPDLAHLVPQHEIVYGNDQVLSILEAGHRLGDAVIRCTDLQAPAQDAFVTFQVTGDAAPIAALAPTSLVFGVWDSRDTQAKLPRLVQSVIRAWDVSELRRSAQYAPPLDYADLDVFSDEDKEKQEGNPKSPLAQRGYVHVPSVDQHGGIVVHDRIERTVTVNLVGLRRLDRGDRAQALRRYILGLALVAATEPPEAFLRQGCLLTLDPEHPADWTLVARDGGRTSIELTPAAALDYATAAAQAFGVAPGRRVVFDKARAHDDVGDAAGKKKGGRAKTAG